MSLLPNLDELDDEQKMAVLESVQKSIAQSKEIQKRKIGENVDLVVQALKKIEEDIRSRYDDIGNAIEKRVASIKDGRDGIDGRDGKDGKDGKQGKEGRPGRDGKDGKNGLNGVDGQDGVSVVNAHIDFDGSLIISLSSGKEINVGEVVAPALAEQIKVITNGGGTSQSVLDTLTSLQSQIDAIGDAVVYKGLWNASTNSPTITSGVGTSGNFYIVSVAGSTNLDGITNWKEGDWAVFNGVAWQRVEGGADGNFTTVTASSLTSGRVTYAGAGGLLQDSSNLTFNGTTLTSAGFSGPLNGTVGATTPNTGAFTSVTSTSASGILTRAAATQDGVELVGRAGGTTSLKVTFTPTTLTASRTLTLPDASGTILQSGTAVTVAQGGTGITSGTSGGVPYFSSTSAIASSAALAANALVIGGGAGAAPSTTTTGTGVLTALGVNTGSAGAFVVNGGALGTPSSGTVTNLTGTASININGTVGATTPSTGAFTTLTTSSTVTLNGGTANGVAYLDGSKVLTSGSALIWTGATQKLGFQNAAANGYGYIYNAGAGTNTDLGFEVGGTERARITSSGVFYLGSLATNFSFTNGSAVDLSGSGTGLAGNGTNLTLGVWNGPIVFQAGNSGGALVERARIDSSGNVGIGTSSPSSKLQVANGALTISDATTHAFLKISPNSGSAAFFDIPTVGSSLLIRTSASSTTDTNSLTITSSGNVNIGSSAYTRRLSVKDTTNTVVVIEGSNSGSSNINFADSDSENPGSINYSHATNYMAFQTAGAERARIDSSGNVGIGMTPSSGWRSVDRVLQIQSSGVIRGQTNANLIDLGSNYYINNSNLSVYIASDYASRFTQYQGVFSWESAASGTAGNTITWTERMRINASGNVGIGLSTVNDKLSIVDGNYLSFQTASQTFNSGRVARIGGISVGSGNGYMTFETYQGGSGGGERMRIDSSGNVGIGTSSPTTKLQVNGTVTATAFAGALTAAQVGDAYAGLSAGSVGSLVLGRYITGGSTLTYGQTTAGSNLYVSNAAGGLAGAAAVTVSGTWRCLGTVKGSEKNDAASTTIFIRIS